MVTHSRQVRVTRTSFRFRVGRVFEKSLLGECDTVQDLFDNGGVVGLRDSVG